MSLKKLYETIATTYTGTRNNLLVKNPLRYYFDYGMFLLSAQAPKLAYINNYEPEYTRKEVKHNAPIVLSMFAATFLLSEIYKRSRTENKKKWSLWGIWSKLRSYGF